MVDLKRLLYSVFSEIAHRQHNNRTTFVSSKVFLKNIDVVIVIDILISYIILLVKLRKLFHMSIYI